MSTATIYAHRFDAANDEATGVLGTQHDGVPAGWLFSNKVACEWERAANRIETPATRKVLLRTAVVMSPDKGGPFDILLNLVRKGLGGTNGAAGSMCLGSMTATWCGRFAG
jgi:NAD dependent epimerase/dehydratase family enzyme